MKNIREVLKTSSMGVITTNQRILNICKETADFNTDDFINNTDRMRVPGWGENSEDQLSSDLSLFILRELLKLHDPEKVMISNVSKPGESLDEILRLSYPSLETLYLQRHDHWWRLISSKERENHSIIRITDYLNVKWPDNYANKKLSDYRFPTPRLMLKVDRFGKKKLHSLMLAIAWAALSEENLAQPKNVSPFEALALAKLNRMEKNAVEDRYEDDKRRTLDEVGRTYSVTRERIRQLEANAVTKIRLLELQQPVIAWLEEQAPIVWGLLSQDGGQTIAGIGDGRNDYKKLPGEVEFGLLIADWDIDKFLRRVGENISGYWYRK